MRKIALDIGQKSCGIALSDSLCITAQGIENYLFNDYDWNQLLKHLETYFEKYEIDLVVIGYPTYPSGDKSATTLMIEEVAEKIKKHFSINTVFVDENNTTKQAHEIMIQANMSRAKRKNYKDKIAAQLILMNYLANH